MEVELRYALCAQAGGATVMLDVSVGITNGTLPAGMTVPLGPTTIAAGMLAGLALMPLLAGLGLELDPNVLEVLYVEEPLPPIMAAVTMSAAATEGLAAGKSAVSAASTIPCLVKCIFQQAKILEGEVFTLLLSNEASRHEIVS